jgi:hypothetical protein
MLCPNCNAIGALLSELYDFGPDAEKLAVTFIYLYRYIKTRAYSTATLYENCKAIGEQFSEI